MLIAVLGQPSRAGEVAFPCATSACGFPRRVDVEHDPGGLRPVVSVGFGIEQAEIGDEMLPVIRSQAVGLRRYIIDVGSSGGLGLCMVSSSLLRRIAL